MSLWIGLKMGGRGSELAPYQMSCFNFGYDPINVWELVPYDFKSANYMAGFPLFDQYLYLFEVKFISSGINYTVITTANNAQDLRFLVESAGYEPPINFIKVTFKGFMWGGNP